MASQAEDEEQRSQLLRQAKLYKFRKCLFQSPISGQVEAQQSDTWVGLCNVFQVDMQVQAILTSSQKEAHHQRLEKLRQELDYIKTDSWKYKAIEELIGF